MRGLLQKVLDLIFAAEPHRALHPGTVIPGPVEEHDLPGGRKVFDVALVIPLGGFALGRLFQGDDACPTRVQVFGEALDRAAFAGRVASLEDDHQPSIVRLEPLLQLEQFDL